MIWKQIKAEYIAGGTTHRKLCEKYGVSRTTLQRKAKAEDWLGLRRQAEAKAESKIVNAVSDESAKIDETYFRCVNKLMGKVEELIENTPVWQVNSLKEMATTLKYLKECKGLKSDLDIKEQKARIKKLEKELEVDGNNPGEVVVTFGEKKEEQKWAE